MAISLPNHKWLVAAVLAISISCVASPSDDATRISDAMNLKAAISRATNNRASANCVNRLWPKKSNRLNAALISSFTATELAALADFFESASGRKWNQRSAAEANNMNPAKPHVEVPSFSPEELQVANNFLNSATGLKFLQGEGSRNFYREVMAVGYEIGQECYAKRDS